MDTVFGQGAYFVLFLYCTELIRSIRQQHFHRYLRNSISHQCVKKKMETNFDRPLIPPISTSPYLTEPATRNRTVFGHGNVSCDVSEYRFRRN